VYFRTLPIAYTNNPFFQNFFSRTTPSPQRISDTVVPSEMQGSTGRLTESINLRGEALELGGAPHTGFRHTQASPQQSLPRKSGDLATDLGIPDVENIPTSLTQEEVSETFINKPLFQLTESINLRGESFELGGAPDTGFRHTQASPQQSLPRKSGDLATNLGIPEVDNIPTSLTPQEVPETFINKPLFQTPTNTDAVPLPAPVTDPKFEQKHPQANVNSGENEDSFGNTVELRLLDHRWMFFIPDADEDFGGPSSSGRQTGNTTGLSISVPGNSHVMHFRHDAEFTADHNLDCPRCHPGFLVPGTCHPCVIIR
jgi:hypothetical protein